MASQLEIKHHHIPSFTFISGDTIPINVAHTIINPTTTPCQKHALIPTCYGGRISTTLAFPKSLHSHTIVVVAMLGNGESSSPSNTPSFPSSLDYRDQIKAQHALCEALYISYLDVVAGFSMGGQQAYYWASMYPTFVSHAVVICGSAKTSGHNCAFLEGPIAALTNSIDYDDGKYREKGVKPVRGLKAFTRAYRAWLHSPEWYRQEQWRGAVKGAESVGGSVDKTEGAFEGWDPEDLLILARMWQGGDIGIFSGGLLKGDYRDTLANVIQAKVLIMPSRTDQYFRHEDSEIEAMYLQKGKLAVIDTVWGHVAGGGANPKDTEWMEEQIAVFLGTTLKD